MHCVGCGKLIPDDVNFCAYCGKPQKGGDRPPDQEERWETCEIVYSRVRRSLLFVWKLQFWADAYGPKGKYCAAKSSEFISEGNRDFPYGKPANAAIEELENKLLKEGWDHIGQSGAVWWSHVFRRRAK